MEQIHCRIQSLGLNMRFLNLWNIFIHLLISSEVTGNSINGNERDIIDAVAGERFIIRTWLLNGSGLSINVKKRNITHLNAFYDESTIKHHTVQNGQLILKYNHTIKEVLLMLDKVSRDYEGVYQIEESFYRTKADPHVTETKTYQRKDGRWSLELNVIGSHELKESYVGENITMVFGKSPELSILYNYDLKFAILAGSYCGISTFPQLCGRLNCESHEFNKSYITIKNVTQGFAGLYRLVSGKVEIGRYFLNIKDKATSAVVGDNARIGWFYNQQGMNRTIMVTHPNKDVMMLVTPNNIPEIKSNFKHRLLYGGDASDNFMLFMLLNVRQSDAGVYTIETLHGNTIPGCKELIVEEKNTISIQGKGTSILETMIILIFIGFFGVISLLLCCLIRIRIRRKNASVMEPDQTNAHEEFGSEFYLTPVCEERPMPIPLVNDYRKGHSDSSHNPQFDSSLRLLQMTPRLCMDIYETFRISCNDDSERASKNEGNTCKENTCQATAIMNTHIRESSGYFAVLGNVDTSV